MPSEWTVDTLKEHYDELRAQDRRYQDALREADQRAIEAAIHSMDQRLGSLNELRGMATDAQATYMPRAEFEATRRYDTDSGKAGTTGIRQNIALGFSAVTGLVAIIALIMTVTR
jgi:tetrahydromethanopterin S-methyltransferase subunit B